MTERGAALERELATALALAEAAAVPVMKLRGVAKQSAKAGGEPVTEADHAANAIILDGLRAAFPEDAILSEETPSDPMRLRASRVWIIDPIDGTREFIEGTDDFAVQIGLAIDGEIAVGVVYQCAAGRLFSAARGAGAFVEDPAKTGRARRRLVVSTVTDPADMRMTLSRWHRSKKHEVLRDVVRPKSLIPAGSIGVKMGLVALDLADVYFQPSKAVSEWDTAGPDVILREAGGAVTDLFGAPLRYNKPEPKHPQGVFASNGAAHAALVKLIDPTVRKLGFEPTR